jgi:hypothetical protein
MVLDKLKAKAQPSVGWPPSKLLTRPAAHRSRRRAGTEPKSIRLSGDAGCLGPESLSRVSPPTQRKRAHRRPGEPDKRAPGVLRNRRNRVTGVLHPSRLPVTVVERYRDDDVERRTPTTPAGRIGRSRPRGSRQQASRHRNRRGGLRRRLPCRLRRRDAPIQEIRTKMVPWERLTGQRID